MTTPTPSPTPPKRGGWQKGQSGNPAGKRPGVGRITKIRAEIGDHLPGIVARLVTAALAGDTQAAKILLDRSLAPLKPLEPSIAMRLPAGTLTDQARAVVAAVAGGDVPTSQGAQLVACIGTVAKIFESDELLARIEKLEAKFETA